MKSLRAIDAHNQQQSNTDPEVIVWECACGRTHVLDMAATGESCKPERAEVRG